MDIDGHVKSSKYRFAEGAFNFKEGMEVVNPLKNGLVENWDLYESIVNHALVDNLRVNPAEFPLFVCEPSFNTAEQRQKMAELAFEKMQSPAIYFGRNGVLSSFAAGKHSGLIIDIGAGVTTISPISDGYIMKRGVRSEGLAGNLVSQEALAILEAKLKVNTTPQFKILRKKQVLPNQPAEVTLKKLNNLSKSFEHAAKIRLANDFKETVCALSNVSYNEGNLAVSPLESYEFPSGHNGNFGLDRFKIPEVLFNPKIATNQAAFENFSGIPKLIKSALDSCHIDIRPTLLSNVVVTGGSSSLDGFTDRLNNTLTNLFPGYKVRIYAAGSSAERRFGSWIGGSILGSLGTFQQLWISKQEYEEHGASILEKRCS